MLAFSRIPGNAFSFWIRRTLRWSRGRPLLPHEPKDRLFGYLDSDAPERGAGGGEILSPRDQAETRERLLRARYRLDPLAAASTRALYRKNLYLLDILESAWSGLPDPAAPGNGKAAAGRSGGASHGRIRALDVGAQDWHYVFALERWLRHAHAPEGRPVSLRGVEVDGYGIYPDFRSRRDYALAYIDQTGNPETGFEVGDFLKAEGDGDGLDLVTLFYPFVTRHHLLLWGLPLRFFRPEKVVAKAAALLRPGGWMLAFTHTLEEHERFRELALGAGGFELVREGRALSNLVDFHEDVEDRRFSIWRRPR